MASQPWVCERTHLQTGAIRRVAFFLLFWSLYLAASCEGDIHCSNGYSVNLDDKVWLFAVDGRQTPYSFLDENGQLIGFDVDLISKVCEIAQKKCEMVLAGFQECTITNRDINYPGRGLMSNWFDACPRYAITADRRGAFDFTVPYKETTASFTVAPGNPSSFDPDSNDYSSHTLTHLTGAPTNAQCLNRLKKKFGNIIVAADLPDAKGLLLNGTADALFSARNKIDGLAVLPQRLHCDDGGSGIMLKKGSQLPTWWNPAFNTFVKTGGYSALCSESQTKYNATIGCFPSNAVASMPGEDLYIQAADQKVWLFAVSGRREPFNYIDDKGKLTGFDVDFIDAVCKSAGKLCAPVLTEFTECSFTDRNINYPGRGLMDGWFDACTGYSNSLDRDNGFDFTDAYLFSNSTYSVIPRNPSGFDPNADDFSNFTFTHLTGAYTNAACLNRLGKKFGQIIIAANLPEAKALLFDRKADVLFSPRGSIPDLETFPETVHCDRNGTSMMTKKGSPLVAWWNEAFRSFVAQGSFKELCEKGTVKYSYPIKCIPFSVNSAIMMSSSAHLILVIGMITVAVNIWRGSLAVQLFC